MVHGNNAEILATNISLDGTPLGTTWDLISGFISRKMRSPIGFSFLGHWTMNNAKLYSKQVFISYIFLLIPQKKKCIPNKSLFHMFFIYLCSHLSWRKIYSFYFLMFVKPYPLKSWKTRTAKLSSVAPSNHNQAIIRII